jgi:zinc protease
MKIQRTLGLVMSAGMALAVSAQPLSPRDDIVTGTLDNGLGYIVKAHANPPGRSAMYLHISTGSLNETEEIRGLSHFLEHMAFNGSENFPPGELIPFFESIGLTFGRHQNAFTSFNQTTYILELPDAEPATIDNGMLFLSDVAFGLSLLPDQIDEERGVILEEKRTRLGAQQRVQDAFFKELAPGSTFGERLPIGTEEAIQSVDREDFQQYVDTWYVPSNMTVIVVADTDPEIVVKEIKNHFSRGAFVERPEDLDINLTPYEGLRAVVITDAELREAQVQMIGIREPMPPVTMKELLRDRLVENLASSVFNRRLSKKVNEGEMSMLGGGAFAADLFNALRLSMIVGGGRPDVWQAILEENAAELRRARLHGFTSREIEDARKAMIAGAERSAESEGTLPARAILGQFNNAVASGETLTSAAQDLELVRELVPTITDEEVSQRFLDLYDDQNMTVFVTLPESEDAPTESELLSIAEAALSVTPEAEVDEERPTELMAELPTPGKAKELARHDGTDVWSAWLDNGVRVHVREMDYRKESATITITLAGGRILESEATRGITDVAALALSRPATRGLSSTNVRDLMTGKKASVFGFAGDDTVRLTVSGNPSDFEPALQLAHLLLTEPVIEQAALDQWRESQKQAIEQRETSPQAKLQELLRETTSPAGEVRMLPLTMEDVERVTLDEAQNWLDFTVQHAPIEVSVVGDIDKERAIELVETYIGSLPARERISEDTLDEHRMIDRPMGPLEVSEQMQTQTEMAIAWAGSFGPDASNVRDVRLVNLATQILSTRMVERIREEQQLVYSIRAVSRPASAYPGMGTIYAAGPCKPGNEAKLASEIGNMFAEFAKEGPSGGEVETARKQIFNQLDEQLKEPGYWTGVLSDMTYRGVNLDDVAQIEEDYARFTADEVRAAFAKYYAPGNTISVTVTPAGE